MGRPKKKKRGGGRPAKTPQNVAEDRGVVGGDAVGGGELVAVVGVRDGDEGGPPALINDDADELLCLQNGDAETGFEPGADGDVGNGDLEPGASDDDLDVWEDVRENGDDFNNSAEQQLVVATAKPGRGGPRPQNKSGSRKKR